MAILYHWPFTAIHTGERYKTVCRRSLQGGLEWQHRWMACFAQLVYLIERSKKVVQARSAQQEQEKRRQLAQQPSLPPSGQPGQHGGQPAAAHAGRPPMATDLFEGLSSWRRTAGLAPAGVAAQRWLQQVQFCPSFSGPQW